MSETNNASPSTPIIIYEYVWSIFFSLISIYILVEDRRPDLAEVIGKYKHQIRFKFFRKEVSIVTRSTSGPGVYKVDGKEVDMWRK